MDCSPSAWKCGVLAEASKPASFCAQGSDKQGAHLLSFLFFFSPLSLPLPPVKDRIWVMFIISLLHLFRVHT